MRDLPVFDGGENMIYNTKLGFGPAIYVAGIPAVSVSVSHRYTHSPVSISRVEDWKNTINLLHAALKRITPSLIAIR